MQTGINFVYLHNLYSSPKIVRVILSSRNYVNSRWRVHSVKFPIA